jgi:hypothetical protein
MALPLLAPVVRRRLDPRDTMDVYVQLTQGDDLRDILQPGEEVTAFTVRLTAESVAAGVRIGTGRNAPRYAALVFAVQLSVDPLLRDNPIFSGSGFLGGFELTFPTSLEDREKQYTVGFRVVQK